MRYVSHQKHFGHFDLDQSVILFTSANSKVQDKSYGTIKYRINPVRKNELNEEVLFIPDVLNCLYL